MLMLNEWAGLSDKSDRIRRMQQQNWNWKAVVLLTEKKITKVKTAHFTSRILQIIWLDFLRTYFLLSESWIILHSTLSLRVAPFIVSLSLSLGDGRLLFVRKHAPYTQPPQSWAKSQVYGEPKKIIKKHTKSMNGTMVPIPINTTM